MWLGDLLLAGLVAASGLPITNPFCDVEEWADPDLGPADKPIDERLVGSRRNELGGMRAGADAVKDKNQPGGLASPRTNLVTQFVEGAMIANAACQSHQIERV